MAEGAPHAVMPMVLLSSNLRVAPIRASKELLAIRHDRHVASHAHDIPGYAYLSSASNRLGAFREHSSEGLTRLKLASFAALCDAAFSIAS